VSRNHLTPAERRLASQAGAYRSWATTDDRSARTAAARAAAEDRFALQVDPDGTLPWFGSPLVGADDFVRRPRRYTTET
jgi:hypothetical protein